MEKPNLNKEELSRLEKNLVERLNEVKDIMDSQRDELSVSIRKDVVAVQLKDILGNNADIYSLRNALEDYIKDLYSNVEIIEESEIDENNN